VDSSRQWCSASAIRQIRDRGRVAEGNREGLATEGNEGNEGETRGGFRTPGIRLAEMSAD
jgi:hypothetical protein